MKAITSFEKTRIYLRTETISTQVCFEIILHLKKSIKMVKNVMCIYLIIFTQAYTYVLKFSFKL